MSTAALDLRALGKSSRFTALMTLIGVAVVLFSIGYSVWRLSDTEATLAAEKKQVEELDASLTAKKTDLAAKDGELKGKDAALREKDDAIANLTKAQDSLQSNIAALKTQDETLHLHVKKSQADKEDYEIQLGVLRKEAMVIRDELKLTFKDPAKNIELWAKPQYRRIMATTLIEPVSSYKRPIPRLGSPTGMWYEFTLKLQFPAGPAFSSFVAVMKRDIKSVTYEMNHPYYRVAPRVSKNAADNFAVEYDGAGTLRNVVVKIDIDGVGLVALDYDMTKAHPEAKEK